MTGFSAKTRAVIMARSGGLCEIGTTVCTVMASEIHHRANRGSGGGLSPAEAIA